MIKEELKITEQLIFNSIEKDKESILGDIREEGYSNPAIWDYTVKIYKKR